jgi:hypothetical protein
VKFVGFGGNEEQERTLKPALYQGVMPLKSLGEAKGSDCLKCVKGR